MDVSQAQVNGATEGNGMDDTREVESLSESSSTGSSMDESSDSESSDDSPSVQEELGTPSPLADLPTAPEAASDPSIDHSNVEAPDHALPDRLPSGAEDVDMVDDEHNESQQQEAEQSRRETSAESDDYEPPEPDTGAESPGSAYSPPLSPAPIAILDDPTHSAPEADQPPDEAFLSAPPVPSWESRPLTEVLGAPGVRTPLRRHIV